MLSWQSVAVASTEVSVIITSSMNQSASTTSMDKQLNENWLFPYSILVVNVATLADSDLTTLLLNHAIKKKKKKNNALWQYSVMKLLKTFVATSNNINNEMSEQMPEADYCRKKRNVEKQRREPCWDLHAWNGTLCLEWWWLYASWLSLQNHAATCG